MPPVQLSAVARDSSAADAVSSTCWARRSMSSGSIGENDSVSPPVQGSSRASVTRPPIPGPPRDVTLDELAVPLFFPAAEAADPHLRSATAGMNDWRHTRALLPGPNVRRPTRQSVGYGKR